MIKDRTGATPVPIQMPIGAEDKLEGIVDLVTMKEWVWKGEDLGASWVVAGRSATSLKDRAEEMRARADRDRRRDGRRGDGAVPGGRRARRADAARADPQGHAVACPSCRCWRGSAFKNKGVQPLLNAVIDYLPGPLDVPAYMGFSPDDETETRNIARRADDDEPFSGLAFKIMNDPFVGSLTFTRDLFGHAVEGRLDPELDQGQEGAHRPHDDDALEQPRGDRGGLCRRHHRARGPEGHHHRRHALRLAAPGRAGDDDLPRPGDRDRRRAEDEGRPGEDVRGPAAPRRRGPVLPRRDRHRDRARRS